MVQPPVSTHIRVTDYSPGKEFPSQYKTAQFLIEADQAGRTEWCSTSHFTAREGLYLCRRSTDWVGRALRGSLGSIAAAATWPANNASQPPGYRLNWPGYVSFSARRRWDSGSPSLQSKKKSGGNLPGRDGADARAHGKSLMAAAMLCPATAHDLSVCSALSLSRAALA